MTDLMDRTEYSRWWQDNTDSDGEVLPDLPKTIRTLAAHIQAFQGRVDGLLDVDDHDQEHGRDCRCNLSRCGCAYDHPDAVCMVHEGMER